MKDEGRGTTERVYFFNYHEYNETYYIDPGSIEPLEHSPGDALIITHFPNIYVPLDSIEYGTTRIVRIPRRYDHEYSLQVPYFSEELPGHEEASVPPHANGNGQDGFFYCEGQWINDGQWYGKSSESPLSNYMDGTRFRDVVREINECIKKEYDVIGWRNVIDLLFCIMTFGLWGWDSSSKIYGGDVVEDTIENINGRDYMRGNGVQIISLRRSGYLSLDFQVPMPRGDSKRGLNR